MSGDLERYQRCGSSEWNDVPPPVAQAIGHFPGDVPAAGSGCTTSHRRADPAAVWARRILRALAALGQFDLREFVRLHPDTQRRTEAIVRALTGWSVPHPSTQECVDKAIVALARSRGAISLGLPSAAHGGDGVAWVVRHLESPIVNAHHRALFIHNGAIRFDGAEYCVTPAQQRWFARVAELRQGPHFAVRCACHAVQRAWTAHPEDRPRRMSRAAAVIAS